MSIFERYLTLWVALCIVAGIALGHLLPGAVPASSARRRWPQVNLPVAVLIWLMIMPMLMKIDFARAWPGPGALARHRRDAVHQLGGQAVLDGAARLAVHRLAVPRRYLPAEQIDSYIAGLIMLAAAPCTAMVFVWSNLCDGEPHFTLSQVALNDTIMVFAFAPIVGAAARPVGDHRAVGDAVALGRPVHRRPGDRRPGLAHGAAGERRGGARSDAARLGPVSLIALLATLVLLFGFQGEQISRSR